jgi:hypothetical protein
MPNMKADSKIRVAKTPPGIEPAIFGLVVQCLKRLRYTKKE